MKQPRILIVDEDPEVAGFYQSTLAPLAPQELIFAASLADATRRLSEESFDLVVAALHSPESVGSDLVQAAHDALSAPEVVLIDAAPPPDTTVADAAAAGSRWGAGEYLPRSLAPARLAASATRLLEKRRLGAEHQLLRRQVERPYSFDDMIGASPAIERVFATIAQVAGSNVDVLVLGDTGTGKELVARALHRRSARAKGPFVPVDCGAIPENLMESELFGHERGAFTGADARRIGLLEFADGGTLFLDELGELPLALQAKLLRTLQERKVRRVGGREEVSVDVRLVAATSRDLDALVRQERFRQDLYYRIHVVRIEMPPLRNRGDDIGLLAEYFAHRYSREMGKHVNGLTPEAYQVLKQYPWPGNVRELQNIIRRGLALTKGTMIGLDDLPDDLVAAAGQNDIGDNLGYFQIRAQHMAKFERQYLKDLLTRLKGDVSAAAKEAKLPRGTLYRLLKNHNLDSAEFRG
jgi:DNA-binding NtrC family response regulator